MCAGRSAQAGLGELARRSDVAGRELPLRLDRRRCSSRACRRCRPLPWRPPTTRPAARDGRRRRTPARCRRVCRRCAPRSSGCDRDPSSSCFATASRERASTAPASAPIELAGRSLLRRRLGHLLVALLDDVEAEQLLVERHRLRVGRALGLELLLLVEQRRHALRANSRRAPAGRCRADRRRAPGRASTTATAASCSAAAHAIARRRARRLAIGRRPLPWPPPPARCASTASALNWMARCCSVLHDVGVGVAEDDVRRLVRQQRGDLVLVVEAQQRAERDVDVGVGRALRRPVVAGAHVDARRARRSPATARAAWRGCRSGRRRAATPAPGRALRRARSRGPWPGRSPSSRKRRPSAPTSSIALPSAACGAGRGRQAHTASASDAGATCRAGLHGSQPSSPRPRDAAWPVAPASFSHFGLPAQLEIGARLAGLDVVVLAADADLEPALPRAHRLQRHVGRRLARHHLAVRLVQQLDRIDLPLLDLHRRGRVVRMAVAAQDATRSPTFQ